jgi:Putative auto-transporter adhesin, head GIN domain
MNTMKLLGTIILASAALTAGTSLAADSYDSHTLVLRNVMGTVHIRTTNGSKITVDIDEGEHLRDALEVSNRKGAVLVRGKKVRNVNCSSRNGKVRLSLGKSWYTNKKHPLKDFPTLTVSVPKGTNLEISGGRVFGDAGNLADADVQVNGCGNFTIGDVSGDLDAQVNGSGDFMAGAVDGDLDAQVNGSGDLSVGDVRGGASTQVNGSGDLNVGRVANGLHAQINGSGDIEIASANGEVNASINGSGDISIKGGTASPFNASIAGSGDVGFQGHANGVSARVIGSGDITLASYEGEFHASKRGVHVGKE